MKEQLRMQDSRIQSINETMAKDCLQLVDKIENIKSSHFKLKGSIFAHL